MQRKAYFGGGRKQVVSRAAIERWKALYPFFAALDQPCCWDHRDVKEALKMPKPLSLCSHHRAADARLANFMHVPIQETIPA